MKKSFWLTLVLALAAYVLLPLPGQSAPLSSRIQKKRSAIEHVKKREGVLTTTISGYNNRISRLQGEIRGTRLRLGRVQGELDHKRNELIAVRNKLEVSRDRLERLRRELRTARRVLAARLVEIYKSDPPDALTVVLEADGFSDLLDRADFLGRISDQDRGVTNRVRGLRDKSQKQTDQLAGLERRVRVVATQILQRRDQIASAQDQLVSSQTSLRGARNARSTALASVRTQRHGLEEDLASMEREQARVQAALAGAGNTAFSGPAGPIKRGSGRLIWPVNGPITGSFGEQRPGHIHAGIDIAAPTGTPIRAADSGRVVLMAYTGGYGNYTCIQHTASLSTCYGHQSRFGTSNGASVRQGQVIGFVGSTGHSTGAHLHFETRVNGTPVSPLGYL
jgi:murein DD-endopeptidase MepM/ murein hydrolase activator NlpD